MCHRYHATTVTRSGLRNICGVAATRLDYCVYMGSIHLCLLNSGSQSLSAMQLGAGGEDLRHEVYLGLAQFTVYPCFG